MGLRGYPCPCLGLRYGQEATEVGQFLTEAPGWPRKRVFQKGFRTRQTCQELCNPILKTHCTDHHRRKEMFICYAWVVECWVIEKKSVYIGFVIFSIEEKSEEKLFLGSDFVTGKMFPQASSDKLSAVGSGIGGSQPFTC